MKMMKSSILMISTSSKHKGTGASRLPVRPYC